MPFSSPLSATVLLTLGLFAVGSLAVPETVQAQSKRVSSKRHKKQVRRKVVRKTPVRVTTTRRAPVRIHPLHTAVVVVDAGLRHVALRDNAQRSLDRAYRAVERAQSVVHHRDRFARDLVASAVFYRRASDQALVRGEYARSLRLSERSYAEAQRAIALADMAPPRKRHHRPRAAADDPVYPTTDDTYDPDEERTIVVDIPDRSAGGATYRTEQTNISADSYER